MNEVELIRAQLAAEREHVREVASLCAAATGHASHAKYSQVFIVSCVNYLLFSMRQELARGAAFLELSSRASEQAARETLGHGAAAGYGIAAGHGAAPSRAAAPASGAALGHGAALEPLRAALASVAAARAALQAASDAYRAGRTEASPMLEELGRCAALLERLVESRGALEALTGRGYTVDDWRRAAHVNADSILEERQLRAEVLQYGAGATGL